MYCEKCGNQITDDAKFCPECGESTGTSAPTQTHPPTTLSDAEINQLYEETYSHGYSVALQLTKNTQDAQDVLQEAYITAFDKYWQLADKSKFAGWFNRIVANKCYDFLRKKNPMLFSSLNTDEDAVDFQDSLIDEKMDFRPEAHADYTEIKRLMQGILSGLPDDQRMCVLMYYYDEMSIGEIAETLQISPGTVKSRLNYARQKIKTDVESLEKKGTKLYGIAPIPFIIWMLRGTNYVHAASVATVGVTAGAGTTSTVGTSASTGVGSTVETTAIEATTTSTGGSTAATANGSAATNAGSVSSTASGTNSVATTTTGPGSVATTTTGSGSVATTTASSGSVATTTTGSASIATTTTSSAPVVASTGGRMLALKVVVGILTVAALGTTSLVVAKQIQSKREPQKQVVEVTPSITPSLTPLLTPTATPRPTATPTPEVEVSPEEAPESFDSILSEINNLYFGQSYGIGRHIAGLTTQFDGTVIGETYASFADMTYQGDFSGNFTLSQKIDDYTYNIQFSDVISRKEPESRETINGIEYQYTAPFINPSDEYLLCLPGKPMSDFPDDLQIYINPEDEPEDVLPTYGIYDVKYNTMYIS